MDHPPNPDENTRKPTLKSNEEDREEDSISSSSLGDSINLEDDAAINVQDQIQPYLEIGKQLHVSKTTLIHGLNVSDLYDRSSFLPRQNLRRTVYMICNSDDEDARQDPLSPPLPPSQFIPTTTVSGIAVESTLQPSADILRLSNLEAICSELRDELQELRSLRAVRNSTVPLSSSSSSSSSSSIDHPVAPPATSQSPLQGKRSLQTEVYHLFFTSN